MYFKFRMFGMICFIRFCWCVFN